MENITLENLTPEARQKLEDEVKKQLADQAAKEKAERERYKDFVSDEVDALFDKINEACLLLKRTKIEVSSSMDTLISTKKEVFKSSTDNKTHTASNRAGTNRITKGYRDISDWDGTQNEGVAKIQKYIASLAKDAESANIVEAIQILLKPDKRGQLDPRRILELKNWSEKTDNDEFKDGVQILINAYRIVKSKTFILVEHRDAGGKWQNVELSFADIG